PCRIVIDLHRHPLEQEKISKSPNLSNRSESSLQPADVQDPVPDTAAAEDASDIQVADSTIPQTEIPSALAGKTVPLADLIHKDFPDSPKAAEPTSQGRRTLTRVLGLKIGRIVIDPGHGGHDLGTVGPGGSVEKDLVLKLALRLKEILNQKLGADVVLTRDKDIFVSLEERTKIANEKRADLFLSIHANSSRYSSISGVETYYLDFAKTDSERIVASRENAGTANSINNLESLVEQIAQADKSTESKELASIIQTSLYHGAQGVFPSTKNRGVRSAPFIVLIGAKMPSILTEVAFISNPKDEAKLSDEKNLEQLAEALFSGIEAYMKKLGNYPIAYRAAQTQ
ncbi:MAG: N-acetylmuramoyl-L-alanine amidase, partial [Acidobacteriota bacterium]